MTATGDDYPRSMRDEAVRKRRVAMLSEPHIAPLATYVADLRTRGLGEVPDFDPLDGGAGARVLFLFEKPGPKTSEAAGGSGFISRNNDDPTAEATFRFMQEARIPRKLTVIWNVVPWWNSTLKIAPKELRSGAACVIELADRLPQLRVVVFVGAKAAIAQPYLEGRPVQFLNSDHPSPLVKAKFPERWRSIPAEWAKVHQFT
jgi:hypothetical protein